jgi:hypothetical protein
MPVVPMFHANAWAVPYSAAAVGAKLVFPGGALDGKSVYELIEAEAVTMAAGVPTVWQMLLAHMEVSPALLVGPRWWWGLRYLSMYGLLAWQVMLGPAVSVVRWPSTPPGSAVPCAYLAHLGGVLAPVWVLSGLRTLLWMGRGVLVWDCRS